MRVGSAKGCRVTNEIVVPFCLQYCRGCICGARVDKGRGGEGERTRRKIGPWAPYPDTSSASSETPCDLSTRRVMRTRPTKNYLFLSSSSPRRYPRPGGGGRGGSPRLDWFLRQTGNRPKLRIPSRSTHTDKAEARESNELVPPAAGWQIYGIRWGHANLCFRPSSIPSTSLGNEGGGDGWNHVLDSGLCFRRVGTLYSFCKFIVIIIADVIIL